MPGIALKDDAHPPSRPNGRVDAFVMDNGSPLADSTNGERRRKDTVGDSRSEHRALRIR